MLPPIFTHFNGVFHHFHHPFWGFSPYFWKHPHLNSPPKKQLRNLVVQVTSSRPAAITEEFTPQACFWGESEFIRSCENQQQLGQWKKHLELQTTSFYGCFNWMIPKHYIKNGCFTKHPLKNSCLGYQAITKTPPENQYGTQNGGLWVGRWFSLSKRWFFRCKMLIFPGCMNCIYCQLGDYISPIPTKKREPETAIDITKPQAMMIRMNWQNHWTLRQRWQQETLAMEKIIANFPIGRICI